MKTGKSQVFLNSLCTCAIFLTAVLASASSVRAATSTISASVTIVPPVSVAEPGDLRFSGFVSGATAGTITLIVPAALPEVSPTSAEPIRSGSRLPAGGVKLVGAKNCLAMANCGLGALQIGGPISSSFSGISIQPSTMLTSGDNTITLADTELRYGANGTVGAVGGPGILNSVGNGTVVVGGVLNVAAGQPPGNYTGFLTLLVDY